jgi:hypothetical protein
MTLLDGFEAVTTRLLKAPPDEFNRVLSEEREVFKRARQAKRDKPDPDEREAS